jgi:TetR/AcrR family transcriptional repressor of nem operon
MSRPYPTKTQWNFAMKVTKTQATENRDAILRAASEHIRAVGFDHINVGEIGRAAGMTHGALYSNFKSKEILKAEATKRAFDDTLRAFTGLTAGEFLQRYLSAGHRDSPQVGCPNSALVSDVWRQPIETQEAFRDGVHQFVALSADTLKSAGAEHNYDRAVTFFSAMIGGLALSRAIRDVDREGSDKILSSVARELSRMLPPQDA